MHKAHEKEIRIFICTSILSWDSLHLSIAKLYFFATTIFESYGLKNFLRSIRDMICNIYQSENGHSSYPSGTIDLFLILFIYDKVLNL